MRHLIVLAFCFLMASPQAYACISLWDQDFLFFDSIPEPPPDADVIAKISLSGVNDEVTYMRGTATANVMQVIKTSDPRVRQGSKIALKVFVTSCGPDLRNSSEGDDGERGVFAKYGEGIIIAKAGTDLEDRFVLCAYTHKRRGDGRISLSPPSAGECLPDELEAAKRVKLAAEQGDAKAQSDLGAMYEEGRFIARNKAKAAQWYGLAAEQGDQFAKNKLEILEIMKSLIAEAESGDAEAQYKLGEMHQWQWQGWPADTNRAEAVKWLKLAAEQGYAKAMHALGEMYKFDDKVEAEKWFRQGAELGDAESQYRLGGMYELGQGIKQSYAEAVKWYRLAADFGHEGARRALEKMEKQAPPATQ